MSAGDLTQGRRIYATHTDERGTKWYPLPHEGDYYLDEHADTWYARPPGAPPGVIGSLANHQVAEHEDGAISVSPSILITGGRDYQWHGYLEHGVWREV